MSEEQFDIFLSHCSGDKDQVIELKGLLVAREFKAWLDKDELPPGQPWVRLLESGLSNSSSIAACFGRSGKGPWHEEEMEAALILAVREGRPVIPVILPGVASEPDLPLFLQNRIWLDCRHGFSDENIDRLVWGMTGRKPEGMESRTTKASEPAKSAEEQAKEVFGPIYPQLSSILDKHDGLRKSIAKRYELPNDSNSETDAELLTRFHDDFFQALAHFEIIHEDDPSTADGILELVSTIIYLSMCPFEAGRLVDSGDDPVLEVSQDAKQGIAEMLLAWKKSRGERPVDMGNLSKEKAPEIFETPPQIMESAIKQNLMQRLGIDPNTSDADLKLESALERAALKGRPEFLTLPAKNDQDRVIAKQLHEKAELRHLILLIKASGQSIHPEKNAASGGASYDYRFEDHLRHLKEQIDTLES